MVFNYKLFKRKAKDKHNEIYRVAYLLNEQYKF